MAQFRAEIQGNRGEASRLGTKSSGITTTTASWQGAVKVQLWYDEKHDRDMYMVQLIPWHGKGTSQVIVSGMVGEAI